MFRRRSNRSIKDLADPAAASPVEAALPPPNTAPPPVVKIEPKKKASPPSIVPPGTQRVLVVGKFVVMTADVSNCDAVIVQGNLDGEVKAKYIVIMKGDPGALVCHTAVLVLTLPCK